MKYLYGPVSSRRLGVSLGVDLTPHKTCSYDCVYCQCGRTTRQTTRRAEYVPTQQVIKEIKTFIRQKSGPLNYISFAGSGEPTLHSGIGKIIREIKGLTDTPIAVITNSSLLWRRDVQKDISQADIVMPSLDAATHPAFKAVNRPGSLKADKIIQGLIDFRKAYKGQIWLEILFARFYNDDSANIRQLKKALHLIKPDRIQINTVTRPPADNFVYPLAQAKLKKLVRVFGKKAELIAYQSFSKTKRAQTDNPYNLILALLSRRPCPLKEISSLLGMNESATAKYIRQLINQDKLKSTVIANKTYYHFSASVPMRSGIRRETRRTTR